MEDKQKGCAQILGHRLAEKEHKLPFSFSLPAGWNADVAVVVGTVISEHKMEVKDGE